MKISIVGYGNVGSHLVNAFKTTAIDVTHVFSNQSLPYDNFHQVTCLDDLPDDQLTIVCVPDAAINTVISQMSYNIPLAYTSGSVKLSDIDRKEKVGVFYPLQTFTKGRQIEYHDIPFFIESKDENFGVELFHLAQEISNQVLYADSKKRAQLHQVAVWVNNFVNHILFQAKEKATKDELDFSVMIPLLKETIQKAVDINPFEAQTGPARRNDRNTIHAHLEQLDGSSLAIYTAITNSILKTYYNEEL